MFKRAAKSIANALLGRYRLLRIYRAELDLPLPEGTTGHDLRGMAGGGEMLLSGDPVIREHAWFAEGNAHAFGLWEDGKLACACVVWDRDRFADNDRHAKHSLAMERRCLVKSAPTASRIMSCRRGGRNMCGLVASRKIFAFEGHRHSTGRGLDRHRL